MAAEAGQRINPIKSGRVHVHPPTTAKFELHLRPPNLGRQMASKDSILRQQVFILQQKLLIHSPGHVR